MAVNVTLTQTAVEIRFVYDPGLVMAVKEIPGRKWEPERKVWTVPLTTDALVKLKDFIEHYGFNGDVDKVVDLAGKMEVITQESIEASRAAEAEIEVEGLGGIPYPFQRAGIKYAVEKQRVIIGDEMGLGKTIMALASVQALSAYPTLVICPASLKYNWYNETRKWLPTKTIQILGTETVGRADANVAIINYDQLKRYRDYLVGREFKAVICDESHFLKSSTAQRSQFVEEIVNGCIYGRNGRKLNRREKEQIRKPVGVRLLLSGTPLLNRPDELVSQLQIIDRLREFGGWYGFMQEFCGLSQTRWGMDTSGAKHLKQLNDRLRASCYIRRLKSEVLKELPAKQRTVVPTELTNRAEYDRAERNLIQWLKETQGREKADVAARAEQLVRIEALKQLSARGKMAAIKEWIKDFLDTDQKLVVFCSHHETIDRLMEEINGSSLDWSKVQSVDSNSAGRATPVSAIYDEKKNVAVQMPVRDSQGSERIDLESGYVKGMHGMSSEQARSIPLNTIPPIHGSQTASESSRNRVPSEMAGHQDPEAMPNTKNPSGIKQGTGIPMGSSAITGSNRSNKRIHPREYLDHKLASEPTETRRNSSRAKTRRSGLNSLVAVQIDGRIPPAKRQEVIERFQNDPTCRLIILQIQTGGVGITLTAASNVLFAELGWNPPTMDQASSRCHRIGQKDNVMEWWFIGRKTIDEDIQELIEKKRAVVDAATDGVERAEEVSVLSELVARLRGERSEAPKGDPLELF